MMKTLRAVCWMICLYFLTSSGAKTAMQEPSSFFSLRNNIGYVSDFMRFPRNPESLPDGEYVGHANNSLVVFRKKDVLVTGSYYSSKTPHVYCVVGGITLGGELVAEEIILANIYNVNNATAPNGNVYKDHNEISLALEDFKIMPWKQFKQTYGARYEEAARSMWAILNDCDHFFTTLNKNP